MAVLGKALPPGWQAPFTLGCSLGLCAGAAAAALLLLAAPGRLRLRGRRRDELLPVRPVTVGGTVPPRSGKRKVRKHLPRGDGAPNEDGQRQSAAMADSLNHDRQVLVEDAVPWLEATPERGLPEGCCVVTGVPDIHEVDPEGRLGMEGYQQWFQRVVELVLRRLPEGGMAIFMQTDVKQLTREGAPQAAGGVGGNAAATGGEGRYWRWVDKAHLSLSAAERVPRARLLWHKIIFSGNLNLGGGRNSGVAGYSHYLCFTTSEEPEPLDSFPFPDVLRKGLSTWVSGSGAQCLEEVLAYLRVRGCKLIVDPFCGEGAVLAVANALGMRALGVDISKKRAKVARRQDGERLLAADRAERAHGGGLPA